MLKHIILIIFVVLMFFGCSSETDDSNLCESDGDADVDYEEEINPCPKDNCATLTGNVTLFGKENHSGIMVSIEDTDFYTTTDSKGNYFLENIPPERYDVVFDAPEGSGYESKARIEGHRFGENEEKHFDDIVFAYGKTIKTSSDNDLKYKLYSGASNEELGIILFKIKDDLYRYSKKEKSFNIIASDIGFSSVSPDWTRILYFENTKYSNDPSRLYSIPIEGGKAILLAEKVMQKTLISPDSKFVLYFKYQHFYQDSGDLYSIPITGGEAVLLGKDVNYDFRDIVQISPDSKQVVFIADYEKDDDIGDFYTVPITGGEATLLGEDVYHDYDDMYFITPDSSRVIYYANCEKRCDFYSASITGDEIVLLGENVSGHRYKMNEDFSKLFYKVDSELYVASIAGEKITLLGENVSNYFKISSDWSRVAYLANMEKNEHEYQAYIGDLYSASTTSGEAVLLATGVHDALYGPHISPDAKKIVYFTNYSDHAGNLYSIPATGGSAILLDEDVNESYTHISPNSNHVVYNKNRNYNAKTVDVYSAPITGGEAVLLGEDLYYSLQEYKITEDSKWVVYINDGDAYHGDLFSVPIEGGEANLLDHDVSSYNYQISPDSSRIIYRKKSSDCLISASIAGKRKDTFGCRVRHDYQISPDWSQVIFLANGGFDEEIGYYNYDLYHASITGEEITPLAINVWSDIQISPDFSRVLYTTNPDYFKDYYDLHTISVENAEKQSLVTHIDKEDVHFSDYGTVFYIRWFNNEYRLNVAEFE